MTRLRSLVPFAALLFCCPAAAQGQEQPPAQSPKPAPTPGSAMAKVTLQIKGSKESDMPVLLSRQLAAGWSTTLGIWDSLWIGTNGHGNIKIWPQPAPVDIWSAQITALQSSLTAETTARASADSAEVTARNSAISAVSSAVSSETAARTAADAAEVTARNTAITSAVATETTLRTTGDATNAAAITSEATTRASADTANATAITTETTARTAADTSLQSQITALQNRTQNKRVSVGAMLLGATQNIAVTWPVAFADTNYNVQVSLEGSTTLLGNVTFRGISAKTTTGCTVTVQAGAVLVAGASIAVTAIHD